MEYELPSQLEFDYPLPTNYITNTLNILKIEVIRNDSNQFLKAHKSDAAFDIITDKAGILHRESAALVSTGLRIKIPQGYVGILKSRSGLAVKHGIEVGAGVIDSGYTGEIKVWLRNFSIRDYRYDKGAKIAQMLILPVPDFQVEDVTKLKETDRGSKGFNSTGY